MLGIRKTFIHDKYYIKKQINKRDLKRQEKDKKDEKIKATSKLATEQSKEESNSSSLTLTKLGLPVVCVHVYLISSLGNHCQTQLYIYYLIISHMYLFLYIHIVAFLTSGSSKGGKFKLSFTTLGLIGRI